MFGSLLKATVGIVTTPVAVVADVVTLGGAMTDKDVPYTVESIENVLENLGNAVDPDRP